MRLLRRTLDVDVENLVDTMNKLGAEIRANQRRIEQLEAEQHGHCRTCEAVTSFPTVDHCGSVQCLRSTA